MFFMTIISVSKTIIWFLPGGGKHLTYHLLHIYAVILNTDKKLKQVLRRLLNKSKFTSSKNIGKNIFQKLFDTYCFGFDVHVDVQEAHYYCAYVHGWDTIE